MIHHVRGQLCTLLFNEIYDYKIVQHNLLFNEVKKNVNNMKFSIKKK